MDSIKAEPTEAAMQAARGRVALGVQKSRQSSIFTLAGIEKLKKCDCGGCGDTGSERPEYCCHDLWSEDAILAVHGRKLKAGLERITGITSLQHSECITHSSSFIDTFLNSKVRIFSE